MKATTRALAALLACVGTSAGASEGLCFKSRGRYLCGLQDVETCKLLAVKVGGSCVPLATGLNDDREMRQGGATCSFTLNGPVVCDYWLRDECVEVARDGKTICFTNPRGRQL